MSGNYIISFPSLDFVWDPATGFSVGGLQIHWYGVLIALGLILAVMYGCGRSKEFGLKEEDILDGVLWIVPLAIVCARAYYCIFEWDSYKDDLLGVFRIWEGGLAIYGGVIGAAIGIVIFAKVKKDKVSLPAVLDLTGLGFLIGQSIGRWGNFINREAYGAVTDSFFRMGLTNPYSGVTVYYHPTFLYESVWNFCGFLLLHFLSKRRRYDGQIALGYVAWYGLGRAFIEGLRTDSLWLGPVRISQVLAAVSCTAAVAALVYFQIRKPDPERLFARRVAQAEVEEPVEEMDDSAPEMDLDTF